MNERNAESACKVSRYRRIFKRFFKFQRYVFPTVLSKKKKKNENVKTNFDCKIQTANVACCVES